MEIKIELNDVYLKYIDDYCVNTGLSRSDECVDLIRKAINDIESNLAKGGYKPQ